MMYGFGWMGWWPLVMGLFWVGVIVLGIWAAKALFPSTAHRETASPTALDTLKRRYARGEISREEYEEARRLLAG
jgi:putative membrane protein